VTGRFKAAKILTFPKTSISARTIDESIACETQTACVETRVYYSKWKRHFPGN